MHKHKRILFVAAVATIALAIGGVVAGSAVTLTSDAKPPLPFKEPKGTPIPAPAVVITKPGEEWIVVPPESRTDIQLIDVAQARLFLPGPDEAADCESGDLDAYKTEGVIRTWLADHRAELAHTSVWDQTLILVTCRYPSEEFPGQLVLYIGIPYDGHSFIAPPICQEKAKLLAPSAPLPVECLTPPDLKPSFEVASYTIIASPEEVLK